LLAGAYSYVTMAPDAPQANLILSSKVKGVHFCVCVQKWMNNSVGWRFAPAGEGRGERRMENGALVVEG